MNNLNLISREFLTRITKALSQGLYNAARLSWSGINFDFSKQKSRGLVPVPASVKKYAAILLVLLFIAGKSYAQMGAQGAGNIVGTNVDVNTRTSLTANIVAGSSTLTVTNSTLSGGSFASGLTSGDLILVIQMQGASINTSNSALFGTITNYNSVGLYEFRCVSSVPNVTTINVTVPFSNSYTASGKVQVIRIPRYTSFNLASGNSIRPAAWNGSSGGVTVIEVANNATINGTFNASGMGFRGGSFENNTQPATVITTSYFSNSDLDGGNKGESIAGHETDYGTAGYRYGRGAAANGGGGGNSHNAGGGGGANGGSTAAWNGLGNPNIAGLGYAAAWNLESLTFSLNTSSGGGRGGYTYGSTNQNALLSAPGNTSWGGNNRQNVGGYGGRPLNYSTGRIFMGGGGGAGDGNNSAASGGANGGGLIFILCYGSVTGSGTLNANGATAANTSSSHNDAPGGGGGGGTIILSASGSIGSSLILTANGGNGGNQLITNAESEGPGGGGGGGYIAITSGSPTRLVNAGSNGTTSSTSLTEFLPNGATSGGAGTLTTFVQGSIIGVAVAHAGADDVFCQSTNMNGSTGPNTHGTWSVITGMGGVFADLHDPVTMFTGDSFTQYTIVWTVVNNLCQQVKDTVKLTPICQPLPVMMVDFSARLADGRVVLDWATAIEDNLDHFVVQKSYDRVNWLNMQTVYSEGNSHSMKYYQALDLHIGHGIVYYRIKEVFKDQNVGYSKVIDIETTGDRNHYNLYPVPVHNTLNIQGGHEGIKTEVLVFNHVGQPMDISTETTGELIAVDLASFTTGVYFVKLLRNGEVVFSQTIAKE